MLPYAWNLCPLYFPNYQQLKTPALNLKPVPSPPGSPQVLSIGIIILLFAPVVLVHPAIISLYIFLTAWTLRHWGGGAIFCTCF